MFEFGHRTFKTFTCKQLALFNELNVYKLCSGEIRTTDLQDINPFRMFRNIIKNSRLCCGPKCLI